MATPQFSELEEGVLKRWKDKSIFKKSLEQTAQGKRFVFFEGPPTANGRPGIHHVLARVFKDVIPRYKTMRGFFVERKAGWDTQGLPVELEVEKQIGVSGKADIEKFGVEKFNAACRASVWKYQEEWQRMTERIGFWLDLEHPYVTYHNEYIETLWWIFKQFREKDLLYRDYKVVPQCPRCGTALSSHEVAQGYQSVTEESVYVTFPVKNQPDTYILSWTTTPWTLPGNVALAVGPRFTYVKILLNGKVYILAEQRLSIIDGEYEVLEKMSGQDLAGLEYEPLFDGLQKSLSSNDKAFYLTTADFVTVTDGTGVVHTAVMYGEDDYVLGQKIGLPKKHTVNPDGTFNELVSKWQGKFVKDVESMIIDDLRTRDLLFKSEEYTHDYPFCWRCHSPLLYYAKHSWFVRMSSLRDQLIANNAKINWVPEHIRRGRFGEWLSEIKDWAISRERYWGTPLPIWVNTQDENDVIVVGGFAELKSLAKDPAALGDKFDPHKPFIDEIILKKDGQEYRRVPEVADTWFDSGAMPFAQWHYPFENKERVDKGMSFPADYICEAIDQTRGWFYTLLAVATALGYKESPYRNVICLGHVLDAKGQKMSKHIGNVVDPWQVIAEFGIDPVRWYFYTVNQPGEYKRFDPEGLREVVKKTFIILWNVVNFYTLFSSKENLAQPAPDSSNILDRWILAKLDRLVVDVTGRLESYQITEGGRAITEFINDLSTWYVRRSRDRFKSSEASEVKPALHTLRTILLEVSKLMAPFAPFISDAVYETVGGEKESVHLESWPERQANTDDERLLGEMEAVRQVVELVHAARTERAVKVRQPLSQLVIQSKEWRTELVDILKAEVNVHDIYFREEIPESSDWQVQRIDKLAIALDVTVTDELYYQGMIRELIRRINVLRKRSKLTIQDRVELYLDTQADDLREAVKQHEEWLRRETLADAVVLRTFDDTVGEIDQAEFDGKSIRLGIKKR
ncbi:MAG: isoleucine--tRNA ligase [bacterium]|nr:isoleucine--tRNA ligase [bacterium]